VADRSHIEWTDATWNPLVGCTKVSPGCDNCYAETFVNRFAGTSTAFPTTFDVVTMRGERMLTQPLRWKRPRRVFVNSLSDLFHKDVPDEFIGEVFAVMALAPRHTFQLLTKRHARMRSLLADRDWVQDYVAPAVAQRVVEQELDDQHLAEAQSDWWPLPNVWLGVSVEDQHWADLRIPALLQTPAAVRWISAEPLLGALDLRHWLSCRRCLGRHIFGDCSAHADYSAPLRATRLSNIRNGPRPGLDWVVVGGESGPGARPMVPAWALFLLDQCAAAGVPFLFKQWGAHDQRGRRVGKNTAGRELAGRTHDGYPVVVPA
jgi:protein gp37